MTAAVLVLALAGAARAAPGNEPAAKAAYLEGERSFELGKFEDAITAYERAFALDPQPAFIFNIALAHRRQYEIDGKLDHLLRARELYRNYLRLDPASPRRAGVERILGELNGKIEDARKRREAPALVPAPVAVPATPVPPAVEPPPVARNEAALQAQPDRQSQPAARVETTRSSRIGWTIAAVAVAVVVGIAVTVLLTRSSGTPADGPGVDLTPR